jgi:pyruvate/2-oxoglutarate dehydrogenase complex dihydrolipoamide acyltransferase (E2) component
MTDIVVPSGLWDSGDRSVLATWLYAEGDSVQAGVVIAAIMVEKASYDVVAPASGVLRILVQEEAEVTQAQVVGRIE